MGKDNRCEMIKMISTEEIKMIKPGYKIIAEIVFRGEQTFAVFTVKEIIEIHHNSIIFKDKNDKTKIIPISDIKSILIPDESDNGGD